MREYRALALFALNRLPEADSVIEEMIQADPFYRPSEATLPPGIVIAFARARTRLIPTLVREEDERARSEFNEKRYTAAATGFERVLRLIRETRNASGAPETPSLKEFAALAGTMLAEIAARDRTATPPAPTLFSAADRGVRPPVPIRQDIPPWRPDNPTQGSFEGQLDVVIDVEGNVQSATLKAPIHPAYDPTLLAAASKWKYRPATRNGQPVVFTATVSILLVAQ